MAILSIEPVPNRPPGNTPRSIADIIGDFDHITNYINNVLLPGFPVTGDVGYADVLQPGVISGGAVTRDSASQVTVAASTGTWVRTAAGVMKRVSWNATVLAAIPAGPANGRVDQVVVDGNGVVTRLAGTGAAALIANLDDANATASRAAVPAGSLRLWEFVVDNTGVLATVATKFRDRRPWAIGAHDRLVYISANLPLTTATVQPVHTNLQRRFEFSGKPVRFDVKMTMSQNGAGTPLAGSFIGVNGSDVLGSADSGMTNLRVSDATGSVGGAEVNMDGSIVWVPPAPGSYLIDLRVTQNTVNGWTVIATAARPVTLEVHEDLTSLTNNGTV